MDQGLGTLICAGPESCNGLDFPIPNPSVPYILQCIGSGDCQGASIYCPANADCHINCTYAIYREINSITGRGCHEVCVSTLYVYGFEGLFFYIPL